MARSSRGRCECPDLGANRASGTAPGSTRAPCHQASCSRRRTSSSRAASRVRPASRYARSDTAARSISSKRATALMLRAPRDRRDRGRRGTLRWTGHLRRRPPAPSRIRSSASASAPRRAGRTRPGSRRSRRERRRAREAVPSRAPLTLERHLHRRRRARHGHRGASDRPASVASGASRRCGGAGDSFSRYASPGCGSLGCDARAPGVAATRASYSATTASSGRLSLAGGAAVSAQGCDFGLASAASRSPPGISGTASRTDSIARAISRSGFERVAKWRVTPFEAGAPAGQREPGDRLDVDLAIADQCREPAARSRSLDVHSLVDVAIRRSLGEAGCEEEVHHLGRVPGGQRRRWQAERCADARSPVSSASSRSACAYRRLIRRRACRRAAPRARDRPRGATAAPAQRFPSSSMATIATAPGCATTSRCARVPSTRRTSSS